MTYSTGERRHGCSSPCPGREPVGGWTTQVCETRGLCDARPTVTFPAAGHHLPLTATKLYCLVTEARVWTTCPRLLPESARPGVEPTTKSNARTTILPGHTNLWNMFSAQCQLSGHILSCQPAKIKQSSTGIYSVKQHSQVSTYWAVVRWRFLRPCRCICLLSSWLSCVLLSHDHRLAQTPPAPWLSAALHMCPLTH